MQDPDLEIYKWQQQRKQGLFRFIVSNSIPTFLGVITTNIVTTLLFTDSSFNALFDTKLLITVIIVTPQLSITHWWWRERKYRLHNEKYNPHTTKNNDG
ncbi:hypothetical protein [Photobacterium phosphoreum]|uniref:hypothetical protein n=1 Tax=Photobacterium phosphoreum TaxID=659 RepID=UPI000D169195|nr:hypothetical protein [Photobacterium phosphoreum]PSU74762.1 hypothetical protein CTM67_17905 [Photobacterium phosphoreum]